MLRALLTGLVMAALVGQVSAEESLPKLYRVELRDPTAAPGASWKKSIAITTGDYIQAQLFGGSYPGGMIDNVKVEIKGGIIGAIVSKEAVMKVDQEGRIGGIELDVLLKGAATGKAEVSLTPTGSGVQPKTFILDVTVEAKK